MQPDTERDACEAFLLRAGFKHGWENLESQARRMVKHAVTELGEQAAPEEIKRAREDYVLKSDDQIAVDDDAKVSRTDEGTWVQAWVWVPARGEGEDDA